MPSDALAEYIELYNKINEYPESEGLCEILKRKMNHLYYYHLTPSDKRIIYQQTGRPVSI